MKKCSSQVLILLSMLSLLQLVSLVYTAQINAQNIKLFPVPTPLSENLPAPRSFSGVGKSENLITDKRSWTRFKYKEIIATTSDKYGLDPQLIYATIMTESQGRENAYRYEPHLKQGTYCMGQILISTARRLGFTGNPEELYNPEICIDLIGRYHKKNLDHFGDLTPLQLTTAYNTGSPWKRSSPSHLARFNKWFYEES